MSAITYTFSARIWKHETPGGWHFVSLPKAMATEIRTHSGDLEEGWGRLKASAQIGDHRWDTAIWFDTKLETYLLPIKAHVRKTLGINVDSSVIIELMV